MDNGYAYGLKKQLLCKSRRSRSLWEKKKTKQQILLQLNLINKADVKRVGRLLCIPTRALETNIQGHCINIFCRMVRGGKERKTGNKWENWGRDLLHHRNGTPHSSLWQWTTTKLLPAFLTSESIWPKQKLDHSRRKDLFLEDVKKLVDLTCLS